MEHSECVVCGSQDLSKKYRCPKCRCRYCSLDCCRVHKPVCPGKPADQDVSSTTATGVPRGVKRSAEDDALDELVVQRAVAFLSPSPVGAQAHEKGWRLTEFQLRKLAQSSKLKSAYGNAKLQELIRSIDSDPDREKALKLARAKPQFEEFVTLLLREIGAYQVAPDGREFLGAS
jgi:hypothetical protein